MSASQIGTAVYDFYQNLHFNEGEDVGADVATVKSGSLPKVQLLPSMFSALDRAQKASAATLLEAGCGIGWLSLSCGYLFPRLFVTAIDFSDRALRRAAQLSERVGAAVHFEKADILDRQQMESIGSFDFVVTIGVLHHTGDFAHALKNVLARVKPGGHIQVGLYHQYRRRPLLEHFEAMKLGGADEEEMRREYARLDQRSQDAQRQESWFLDQVLHPHETQHTVGEVLKLAEGDFDHVCNSITNMQLPDSEKLNRIEERQEMLGKKNLAAGNYDPGFFLVHMRRRGN